MYIRNILLTYFALLALLLPLQASDSWNDRGLGLPLVLAGIYAWVLLVEPHFFIPKWWRWPALYSALLFFATVLPWYAKNQVGTESIRLLAVIWLISLARDISRRFGSEILLGLLACAAVFHAQWGIAHFSMQQDIGLRYLGETQLAATAPAVAKFWDGTTKLIRAYGPYSHANSLGGALVIGSAAALVLFMRRPNTAWASVWFISSLGVLLTFSRAAWVAYILTMLAVLFTVSSSRQTREKLRYFGIALAVTLIVFLPLLQARTNDPEDVAAPERQLGSIQAWHLLTGQPWWYGTGPGQYTTELRNYLDATVTSYAPWQIAPVHAVPLLLAVEWGVVLAFALAVALWWPLRNQPRLWPLLAALSPLVLLDHYLATASAPVMVMASFLVAMRQSAQSDDSDDLVQPQRPGR